MIDRRKLTEWIDEVKEFSHAKSGIITPNAPREQHHYRGVWNAACHLKAMLENGEFDIEEDDAS